MHLQVKALSSLLIMVALISPLTGQHPSDSGSFSQSPFRLRWKIPIGEMQLGSLELNAQTTRGGERILVGYRSDYPSNQSAVIVLDGGGSLLSGPFAIAWPGLSALSSDGKLLVVATESEHKSGLSWFDADTGVQLRNVTLAEESEFDSLSMSADASLVAVSGASGDSSFIYAFDSQGHELWKQLTEAIGPIGGHYDVFYVRNTVAVSGDGSYVAAARREMTVRIGMVCAGNNGVVLFNRQGKLLWNYTTPDCAWNIALSADGRYVAAATHSQLYGFAGDGRLLWSQPIERVCVDGSAPSIIAISNTGQRLVAGEYGKLVLGNASGPYLQTAVNGNVESVAISDTGNVSAAVLSSFASNGTNMIRQIYAVDDDGHLLENYTSAGPLPSGTSGSHVAVAGNGCCILAALEGDGVYFFTTSPETSTSSIQTNTATSVVGNVTIEILATIVLVAIVGTVIFARNRRGAARKR